MTGKKKRNVIEHDIKLRRAKTLSISVSLAVYTVSITQEKLIGLSSV